LLLPFFPLPHTWIFPALFIPPYQKKKKKKEKKTHWGTLVAHACNLTYSGGRDSEANDGSKLAQVSSLGDPISKIINTKLGW
jgi:hypothetical protein